MTFTSGGHSNLNLEELDLGAGFSSGIHKNFSVWTEYTSVYYRNRDSYLLDGTMPCHIEMLDLTCPG